MTIGDIQEGSGGGGQNGTSGGNTPVSQNPRTAGHQFKKFALGAYLLITVFAFLYALFKIWPLGADDEIEQSATIFFGLNITEMPRDARYAAIVALTGAIGSYIHLGSSFAVHAARGDLDFSWTWWYLHHPWVAMSLALIFYFLLRGGLLTAAGAADLNIYGLAAIGGLAGLSTHQATDKLKELFDTVFRKANADQDRRERPSGGEQDRIIPPIP